MEALDGEGEDLADVGLVGGAGKRAPHVGRGVRGGARIRRVAVPRVEEVHGERCEIWSPDSVRARGGTGEEGWDGRRGWTSGAAGADGSGAGETGARRPAPGNSGEWEATLGGERAAPVREERATSLSVWESNGG